MSTLLKRTLSGAAGVAWLVVAQTANAAAPEGENLAQQWCAQCHGIRSGQTSANEKAPNFADVAAQRTTTEPSLKVFLRAPHATMPNLMLKADEINALVDYIISLKPKR
jgi:mono/diheme cytochrome c family protein